MLDHLFLDTVGLLRVALDESLLEHAATDDRLLYDVLNGDLAWESSVSLPGDGEPPRVSADVNLDWPTWSQSAWRNMSLGEAVEDQPEIGIEVVFRAQRLASRPALEKVLSVLPLRAPELGEDRLARSSPVVEEAFDEDSTGPEVAVEVAYEGSYRLPAPAAAEAGAEDTTLFPAWAGRRPSTGDALPRLSATRQLTAATQATVNALAAWLASTLVRLADLDLEYLPPDEEEES